MAIVTTIRLAALANPSTLYLDARLVYPLGYYNADAAMFMMTALVAVALACRRGGAPVPRVAGLVVAAVCLQLAVLGQSRGWLFTVPLVLAITLLILPGRLRLLVFALGPVAATAAAAPALFQVYGKTTVGGLTLSEPRLGQVLHSQGAHAMHTMLIADVALALAAALAVALDRRVAPSPTTKRRIDRVAAAVAVAVALAGVAVGLVAVHGHASGGSNTPGTRSPTRNTGPSGSSRFTALGSQRVDFWRVALDELDAASAGGHRPGQLRRQLPATSTHRRGTALGALDGAAPARPYRAGRSVAVRAVRVRPWGSPRCAAVARGTPCPL